MSWAFAGLTNQARSATIIASHETPAAPASNLADPRLYRRWISGGLQSSVTLTVSYGGAEVAASHVGLFDVDLDPGDLVTLRFFDSEVVQIGAAWSFAGRVSSDGHVVLPLVDHGVPVSVAHHGLTIEMAGAVRERQAGYLDVSELWRPETTETGGARAGVKEWEIDGAITRLRFPLSRSGFETLRRFHGEQPGAPFVALPELDLPNEGTRAGLVAIDRLSARRDRRAIQEIWNVDLTLRAWTRSDR